MTGDPKMRSDRDDLGRVFNEVPELYDRVRPGYPDELFADLGAITGMDDRSSVLEVAAEPVRRRAPWQHSATR